VTGAAALRIRRTHFPVTALGPGDRLGVWLQGCPLACPGCMSLDTWDPAGGLETTVDALAGRWQDAVRRGASGLTVSGGEPLTQAGPLAAFLAEARRIDDEFPGERDILMFTGFEPDELDDRQRLAAAYADVLVTGRFAAALPTRLIWRGSANQRMVPQTGLGRRRYAPFLSQETGRPPLQVQADEDGVWLAGVPARGTLPRLERDLRRRGLRPDAVSWRPSVRTEQDGADLPRRTTTERP
jgi:anaerobic ribonucleoside-triphosphate reductase activating protein